MIYSTAVVSRTSFTYSSGWLSSS